MLKTYKQIATMRFSKRVILENLFILFFIGVLSYLLFLRYSSTIDLSADAFFLTLSQYKIELPSFALFNSTHPGRPFGYLPWNLALFFGGGSINGYNKFMFTCISLNGLLVFLLFRLILGNKFTLIALLAAIMKLTWSANHELFDNSSLAIYFCETLFWIACLIFTLLKLKKLHGILLVAAYISMVVTLLIPIGIYQPLWLPILLFPILLNWQKPIGIRSRRNTTLLVWYITSLSAISISYVLVRLNWPHPLIAPNSGSTPSLSVLNRFSKGFGPATIESLFVPIVKLQSNFSVVPSWFIALLIGFLFLSCLIFGKRLLNSKLNESFSTGVKRHYDLLWIGLLTVTIGLLPFCVITTPPYGSRYIHWAAFGVILLIFSLVAFLLKQSMRISWILGIFLVCFVIFTQTLETWNVGTNIALVHHPISQFRKGLLNTFPSLQEETFIVFDNTPINVGMSDFLCTFVLRNFTGTENTFCFIESKPQLESNSSIGVTTRFDINNANTRLDDIVNGATATAARFNSSEPSLVKLPKEKVILATWDQQNYQIKLIANQRSIKRVLQERTSFYGTRIYSN